MSVSTGAVGLLVAGSAAERIEACEAYLREPRRPYAERKARYQAAADKLTLAGLSDHDILVDVGAGRTELDVCLRVEHGWRGRYVPVDGWLDGTDLETWEPSRSFPWFAALEVLEHLADPLRLVRALQARATGGIVVTTPTPAVVDVAAMDPTHISPLDEQTLQSWGFRTSLHPFHGQHRHDGITGLWLRSQQD